jgi:hypothetical protein
MAAEGNGPPSSRPERPDRPDDPEGSARQGRTEQPGRAERREREERKRFLLRLRPELHAALERWAADELRSLNGQIEYLLQEAVNRAGRTSRGRSSPPR